MDSPSDFPDPGGFEACGQVGLARAAHRQPCLRFPAALNEQRHARNLNVDRLPEVAGPEHQATERKGVLRRKAASGWVPGLGLEGQDDIFAIEADFDHIRPGLSPLIINQPRKHIALRDRPMGRILRAVCARIVILDRLAGLRATRRGRGYRGFSTPPAICGLRGFRRWRHDLASLQLSDALLEPRICPRPVIGALIDRLAMAPPIGAWVVEPCVLTSFAEPPDRQEGRVPMHQPVGRRYRFQQRTIDDVHPRRDESVRV